MASFQIVAQSYWSIYTGMSMAAKLLTTIQQYQTLGHSLRELSSDSELISHCRHLARTDLYFLLYFGFGRVDIEKQWLLDRCKEIQENPNGYLDLWSREHYKSTIITYALSIQDILSSHGDDPDPKWDGIEVTIGIFSCTRPIAKGFLRQIKMEFEQNETLKEWFPDIIWENPKKDAPKWSEDDGIVLKRKTNPKESTVEAWGLVDGQPTSKHFVERIYDDVVTLESVRSTPMMKKTLESWEMSLNLGSQKLNIERHIGTRYHFNDAYKDILKRGSAKERKYPATDDGTVDGNPVLFTKELLAKKRRDMGPYTFGCQMLQNPTADKTQGFLEEWLRFYESPINHKKMNIVIIVDPANAKKKKSDYTSMKVIGYAPDQNKYVLAMVRDRLNLTERTNKVFELHKEFLTEGKKIPVYYEQYGKDSDIQHIESVMKQDSYYFEIHAIGGAMSKEDRIRRLIPDFENGLIYLPKSYSYVDYQHQTRDLTRVFIDEEYIPFPVGEHDDMLDDLARIKDINVKFPLAAPPKKKKRFGKNRGKGAWMG